MPKGRADWRYSEARDRWRARFYGLSNDDREDICAALAHARTVAQTEYDSYALAMVCQHYLAGVTVSPRALRANMEAAGVENVVQVLLEIWPECLQTEDDSQEHPECL